MCGIVGVISDFKEDFERLPVALETMSHRGPDHSNISLLDGIGLGHARLSIIDTSEASNQPFEDVSGRYTIVFNGEIYNYRDIRSDLEAAGQTFLTAGDTEVLLYSYIHYKEKCLEKLEGFFAFAIYDKREESLFVARDRYGIKPLHYYFDGDRFVFASELSAITSFDIPKKVDRITLFNYLKFNYLPTSHGILKDTYKLSPGHYILIEGISAGVSVIEPKEYYCIPKSYEDNVIIRNNANYEKTKDIVVGMLDEAVKKRLVSDVPLGTFLSGGIDSSVVSTIAAKYKESLNTFSIGYKDHAFYDESSYAKLVADKIGSNHHEFLLSNAEIATHVEAILDHLDEPFADSSALVVYILSKYTREHVTVALSGDGADELFSGYRKHQAEFSARNPGMQAKLVKSGHFLWKNLPKSRSSKITDLNRKLYKFSEGAHLPNKERYWKWASIISDEKANFLILEDKKKTEQRLSDDGYTHIRRKQEILKHIKKDGDINEVLYTDMTVVLPYDMLKKVDIMTMANSLEVRTPFLDHKLVNYVFSLPEDFKINQEMKKKVLQDAFKEYLPEELYQRPKQGFEIPLLDLLRNELNYLVEGKYLSSDFIVEQQVFNPQAVALLKRQLYSKSPEDAPATLWAIIVFNFWWKKHIVHA